MAIGKAKLGDSSLVDSKEGLLACERRAGSLATMADLRSKNMVGDRSRAVRLFFAHTQHCKMTAVLKMVTFLVDTVPPPPATSVNGMHGPFTRLSASADSAANSNTVEFSALRMCNGYWRPSKYSLSPNNCQHYPIMLSAVLAYLVFL